MNSVRFIRTSSSLRNRLRAVCSSSREMAASSSRKPASFLPTQRRPRVDSSISRKAGRERCVSRQACSSRLNFLRERETYSSASVTQRMMTTTTKTSMFCTQDSSFSGRSVPSPQRGKSGEEPETGGRERQSKNSSMADFNVGNAGRMASLRNTSERFMGLASEIGTQYSP